MFRPSLLLRNKIRRKKKIIPHCRNNSEIPHCRNNSKIPHCRNDSKIPHCRNNSKIPHCRNNSKIPHCRNNSKIVERGKIYTANTQIHDPSLSWLGTGISILCGGDKLVFWTQIFPLTEMMWSCKCFPYVSKMTTLTYNRANGVFIKNGIIMNIIYNTFNFRDTEIVICILLVLLKRYSRETTVYLAPTYSYQYQ
jgi:hypothetical protein